MSDSGLSSGAPIPRIDADAVCERCGTVNPEDTLLCKTCGNNLRDQRVRRISSGHVVEIPGDEQTRASWAGKLLIVFMILVFIWVALNLSSTANFLVGSQNPATAAAKAYWNGSTAETYNTLAAELEAHPVTDEESEAVLKFPASADEYDGRYALFQQQGDTMAHIGDAIVRVENNTFYFVAKIPRKNAEVRGEGSIEGTARIVARDTAAIMIRNDYYGASGFAQRTANSGYECLGLSDASDDSCSVIAYRVP